MPKEIPKPWTEEHEQALADYIKFAYEEAKRNKNGETFLPEEQEAYDEAMRRVEALGILDRPEATIKLKALDRRLKFLQPSEITPPPRRTKDWEDPEGQPVEGGTRGAFRSVQRAGSVPRGLPVEPLSPTVIETPEGAPAADAAEGEETTGTTDPEAPPPPVVQRQRSREYPANPPEVQAEIETFLQGLTAEQSARLQSEIRALAGRTAAGNEQAARAHIIRYYSLDAVKKIVGPEAPPVPEPEPERPIAPPRDEKLAAAAERLEQLTPDERSRLDAETEIYAQNRRWELTDSNREQARLRILADYSAESLDRTLHPTAPEPEPEPVPPPARKSKRKETPIPMGRDDKETVFARFAQKQAKAAAAAAEYRPRKPEPAAEAVSPEEDEIQRMLEDARKNEADLTRKEAIQRLLSRPDFYPTTGPTQAERLAREETLAQEDEIRRIIAANPDMSAFAPEEARAQAMRLLENSPDEFPNDGGLTRTQRQQAIKEREWVLLGYEKPGAAALEAPPAGPNIEEAEDEAARAAAAEVAATVAADEAAATKAAQEAAKRQRALREAEPLAHDIEAEQTAGLEERMRQLAGKISESRQQASALLEAYPHLQPSREAPTARHEKPKFGHIARGLITHLGAAAAKTAGSLLGVKILYDLPVWWRQKRTVKKERREVQAALAEMSKTIRAERRLVEERTVQYQPDSRAYTEAVAPTVKRFKDSLEQAQHLSAHEKKEFRKRLARIMAERQKTNQEFREEDLGRADTLSRLYLNTKISGYQVAREALNAALVLAGMPVLRGAAYAATAAAERWSKAGREYEKTMWAGEHSASFRGKRVAQTKDLFLTSTAETLHGLTGGTLRSKEEKERRTGLARTGEFFQAASKLAIAFGIGGAALNALLERPPNEVIDGLMQQFEDKGVGAVTQETLGKVTAGISEQGASGLAEAAAHNWWQNFNDMTERFTALRFDRTSFAPSQVDEPMPVPSEFGHVPKLEDEVVIRPPSEAAPAAPAGEFEHVPKLEDEATVPITEAARTLIPESATAGAAAPTEQLLEKMSQLPMATIEQGGNVWDAAKSLVGEGQGKISAKEFAQAWEHSVRNLPDLVHAGDVVKFVPATGDAPAHFIVFAESGLPTGTAKDLAEVYKNLGKEVPDWLEEKVAPSAEIIKQTDQIVAAQPDEFSSALDELHRDFKQADLAKQEEVLHHIQDIRQRLEYEWRLAADNQDRETALFEEMRRLDATRQRLTLAPDFAGQNRSFLKMLKSAELPEGKLAELKTLTVERLLVEKDSPGRRDFTGLVRLVQDYLKITPSRERPLQLTVEVFLKKFVVNGKAIEPPTAV